jgi:hypothetical protein
MPEVLGLGSPGGPVPVRGTRAGLRAAAPAAEGDQVAAVPVSEDEVRAATQAALDAAAAITPVPELAAAEPVLATGEVVSADAVAAEPEPEASARKKS